MTFSDRQFVKIGRKVFQVAETLPSGKIKLTTGHIVPAAGLTPLTLREHQELSRKADAQAHADAKQARKIVAQCRAFVTIVEHGDETRVNTALSRIFR